VRQDRFETILSNKTNNTLRTKTFRSKTTKNPRRTRSADGSESLTQSRQTTKQGENNANHDHDDIKQEGCTFLPYHPRNAIIRLDNDHDQQPQLAPQTTGTRTKIQQRKKTENKNRLQKEPYANSRPRLKWMHAGNQNHREHQSKLFPVKTTPFLKPKTNSKT